MSDSPTDPSPSLPPAPPEGVPPPSWLAMLEESRLRERQVLERLLQGQLREQRLARWWRGAFYAFVAVYLVALLGLARGDLLRGMGGDALGGGDHVAVVEILGPILPGEEYSAENVLEGLGDAFDDPHTAAVVLRINTPGGSPVQSGLIHDEVVRLRREHPGIPVHAVIEDVCASGGYYVAVAAREIHADRASLVGSIGVILRSFGLREAMAKLGVENRVLTAGQHKNFLDPFAPEEEEQRRHAQRMLDQIHGQFMAAVRQGRGERIRAGDEEKLFSGLIWTGEEALQLGLVDGLNSVEELARSTIGIPRTKKFTKETNWLYRLSKHVKGAGGVAGGWQWGLP